MSAYLDCCCLNRRRQAGDVEPGLQRRRRRRCRLGASSLELSLLVVSELVSVLDESVCDVSELGVELLGKSMLLRQAVPFAVEI